jgi:hypothetical protein
MTLLADAVSVLGKVINLIAPPPTERDELAREQAAIVASYQHLIGRAVVWQEPSTRRRYGIVCEVMVDDELNVWLKADYEITAFDDPGKQIRMSANMWASSFRLPDRQGLQYSVDNFDTLLEAA